MTFSNLARVARNYKFGEQSLVSFENDDSVGQKPSAKSIKLNQFKSIFSTERNEDGYIYMVQALESNGHLTWPTKKLISDIYNSSFLTSNGAQESVCYCHVPKTDSFVSNDLKTIVLNSDEHCNQFEAIDTSLHFNPIGEASSLIIDLFKLGIHRFFGYNNKKRSNASGPNKRLRGD